MRTFRAFKNSSAQLLEFGLPLSLCSPWSGTLLRRRFTPKLRRWQPPSFRYRGTMAPLPVRRNRGIRDQVGSSALQVVVATGRSSPGRRFRRLQPFNLLQDGVIQPKPSPAGQVLQMLDE
jgi:hypothetical protein